MEGRERRGMAVTGIVNAAAGFLGTVGPVDYSLSPGVIAATGCGSRFPLVPAGAILLLASFSPALLAVAAAIPPAVVGGILVYALAGQVAAGIAAASSGGAVTFEDGLVLALPVLAATVCAFLPPSATAGIPPLLRPVAANGVVVGVVSALLLDRLFRPPAAPPPGGAAGRSPGEGAGGAP
jgi:uracil permease